LIPKLGRRAFDRLGGQREVRAGQDGQADDGDVLLDRRRHDRVDMAEALRIRLVDRVYPRASFESSWRSLAQRIAASPSRPIKSVIAAAAPHHHPGLETPAAAAFASLWVADAHWAAADGLRAKS
jgi:hypothetical protein